jgi:Ca2+-transporting ATPase
MPQAFYQLQVDEVLKALRTSLKGLSAEEAQRRLKEYGPNELVREKKKSSLALFLSQFTNFLVVIIIIAGLISAYLGDYVESIAILAIVLMAGVLGFVQEYRAEKALEALKALSAPTARVIRDGKEVVVQARDIVPGDTVSLYAGDKVPADGRLIEAINLRVDEAILTGESVPVEKKTEPIPQENVPISERYNLVFSGTVVVNGRGLMVVTATGMNTEFGKIAHMLGEVKERKTPLQANLDRTSKLIGTFALILCALISGVGIARGYDVLEMFVWGVALAVAIIPEALPAVVTISLALGIRRMVKRQALIRKLHAVETLGCVTYICSDKTGTLTKNEMTVQKVWVIRNLIEVSGVGYDPKGDFKLDGKPFPKDEAHLQMLIKAAVLCNDSELFYSEEDKRWKIKGDPTEGALVVLAKKAGLDKKELESLHPRIDEIPFDSERKMMTTVHSLDDEKLLICSKGAPEVILNKCAHILYDGRIQELTQAERLEVLEAAQSMAKSALRVIGVAYCIVAKSSYSASSAESELIFLGLLGLIDPPRDEAKPAIQTCKTAGIKPVMITGDHKITAEAVARELGILTHGEVISGAELEAMSDEELEKRVERIEVYARVNPESKLRIVKALQKRGHVVAMTGDGVNDAPALKQADIGVAMGITGTEVAKEASDMVLLDDNFATIVAAVEEGRTIYANIRKYLVYLLTGNTGTVVGLTSALVAGLPVPLSAVQILFINLLMDGAPAVALSVEPPEPEVMKKPPRDPKESIFNRYALTFIPLMGLWIGLCALFLFIYQLKTANLAKAMTVFFAGIICMRLANALNCRSEEASLFKLGLFTNKWLILALISSLTFMLLAMYVPFLSKVFNTVPLSFTDWLMACASALSVIILDEIHKLLKCIKRKP